MSIRPFVISHGLSSVGSTQSGSVLLLLWTPWSCPHRFTAYLFLVYYFFPFELLLPPFANFFFPFSLSHVISDPCPSPIASPPLCSPSSPEVVEVSTSIERHLGSVTSRFRVRLRTSRLSSDLAVDSNTSPMTVDFKPSLMNVDSGPPIPMADSFVVVCPPDVAVRPSVAVESNVLRPSSFQGGVLRLKRRYGFDHYRGLRQIYVFLDDRQFFPFWNLVPSSRTCVFREIILVKPPSGPGRSVGITELAAESASCVVSLRPSWTCICLAVKRSNSMRANPLRCYRP